MTFKLKSGDSSVLDVVEGREQGRSRQAIVFTLSKTRTRIWKCKILGLEESSQWRVWYWNWSEIKRFYNTSSTNLVRAPTFASFSTELENNAVCINLNCFPSREFRRGSVLIHGIHWFTRLCFLHRGDMGKSSEIPNRISCKSTSDVFENTSMKSVV